MLRRLSYLQMTLQMCFYKNVTFLKQTIMNKNKDSRTDFLFSTPSFLTGAGSIFNLAGNYYEYNLSSSGEEADSRAMQCDWAMVGNDLSNALDAYEQIEPKRG